MTNQENLSQGVGSNYDRDCNPSHNRSFSSIIDQQIRRRQVLKGSVALAVTSMFASPLLSAVRPRAASAQNSLLGFKAVPISEADTIVVPEGYKAQVILPWGEPIAGDYPNYRLENTGAEQEMQVGSHHDGMHFFPIDGNSPDEGSSEEGFLVINHEYIEPRYMHASAKGKALGNGEVPMKGENLRDADEVLKEMNAHGITIVHIRKEGNGNWEVVKDSRNRRITGLTPMEISGPLRGTDFVKTRYSPDGTRTRGTLNNCAHGVTPWNTYLAAEENWHGYFHNGDVDAQGNPDLPREHSRYGISTGATRYGWELAEGGEDQYIRFDASTKGDQATEDYRNEPNTFGWMVEIDPFNPNRTPQKRTALGRFRHEGLVFQPVVEGQPIVCYSGDDARFEYIYKYVSAQPYFPETAGGHLLDNGTLYVARFNEDGSGEWLPLVLGQNGLTPSNGFNSQADILVNARSAADFVGATKMDRPEWGAVDVKTKQVYFTLTNNTDRESEQTDAVNPRPNNRWGQIVRWQEENDNSAANRFQWELFVLAGTEDNSKTFNGKSLSQENMFANPDGLWMDADSRLWIQTDGGIDQFGNNMMLAANPEDGTIRRFLTGPIGQEITGVITTPDQRTMFINVQHPGATLDKEAFAAGNVNSRWPDGNDSPYPRSATVVITKEDGGIIGS
ncbi:MAG: PhoX family protein [Cyanobacteriota bacterium]